MIGTFLLFILFIFFFIKGNTKAIVVIIVISLMNDLFVLSFGFTLAIHYLIAIAYIPKLLLHYKLIPKKTKHLIAPLYIEFLYLIFLAIIFGYIEPWVSRLDYERTWSQRSEGRAIIQVLRLVSEFSLVLIIVLWLKMKQITIDYIVKVTAITISFIVLFTLIDFALGGILKEFFFPEGRLLSDRFTGLNGEPRAFGRICSFVLLLLLSLSRKNKETIINVGIALSILGLVISLSASAYLMTLVWLAFFIVITKRYKYFFWGIPFMLFIVFFLSQNEMFRESTIKKIESTVSTSGESYNQKEKVNAEEPDIFSNFEIFDRAALNFLYSEPLYFLTGTGANMISIPASPFLIASHASIYEDKIDSVPHSFLINLIARSGVVGAILWFVFFLKFKKALRNSEKEIKALFVCVLISYFIVTTSIFFLILAVLLFSVEKNEKQNLNRIYDKYYNTSSKWS